MDGGSPPEAQHGVSSKRQKRSEQLRKLKQRMEAVEARLEALEAKKGAAAESTGGMSGGGERPASRSALQTAVRAATQDWLVLSRLCDLVGDEDKLFGTVAVASLSKDSQIGGIIIKGHGSSTRNLREKGLIEYAPCGKQYLRITEKGWAAAALLGDGVPATGGGAAE